MKNFILLTTAIAITLLNACSPESQKDQLVYADSLIAVNKDLIKQLEERDQLIKSFMDGFNEIQANLEEVRNK